MQPRSLHAMKVTVSLQSAGPVSLPQPALETRGGRWQLFVEEDKRGDFDSRVERGSDRLLRSFTKQSELGYLSLCF